MKREFLKNFKIGEQELPKEIIDAILDENSGDIETTKAKFADYDTLKEQLTQASKTIEGFKDMDIDAVRREADEWKAKATQAEQDATAKIADMAFQGHLSGAIAGARGKNAKAVMALLDLDALKTSKNQEADIKTALEGLKKESGYLFEDAAALPPFAPGTGKDPLLGGALTKETFGKMGYHDRLTLKKEHPEIYETVKE